MGALEHLYLNTSDVGMECRAVHDDWDEEEEIEEVMDRGLGSRSEITKPIEEAVRILLQGLGEDLDRDGLKKTPLRVARAFRDATRGYKQKVNDIVQDALFPEAGSNHGKGLAGGVGGLVIVRDIILFSCCESCLLPFKVRCHVAYVPSGERVVGLSKLARVADVFAKRLQSPQRLADEICSALQNSIKPAGVAVALQCWHIQSLESPKIDVQMMSKTDMHGWDLTCVSSSSGAFKNEHGNFWIDLLTLLKFKGVDMEKSIGKSSSMHCWCPSASNVPSCNGHGAVHTISPKAQSRQRVPESTMISAVTSILKAIGEDPLRKELTGTPYHFVQWLMRFKKSAFDFKISNTGNGSSNFVNGSFNYNDEVTYELNLPFCAQCEHHLLPFHGVAHVAYFKTKGNGPFERSFMQSIVNFFGCKLQVQERFTRQIAETVSSLFDRGVMVVVEASHICMLSRGIEKVGSTTATVAVIGEFATNLNAKATFLQSISDSCPSNR